MFRGTGNSEPHAEHLGVGSIILYNKSERWMIVAPTEYSVILLNLSTFKEVGKSVSVEDIHFISSSEFDELRDPLPYARSDLDYDLKGMKNL